MSTSLTGAPQGPRGGHPPMTTSRWAGADLAADGDRDLQGGDAGDGPGLVLATDGTEPAGGGDGQHHHAGGEPLPAGIDRQAEGVPEDQLLQGHAGGEPQRPGAQPAD